MGALVLLFLAASALAQDTAGVGSLKGIAKTESGEPAAGARICLKGLDRCVDSDSTGHFRLTEVRAGTYDIEVTASGGVTLRKGGVEVRAGLEGMVEIALPAVGGQSQQVTVTESVFVAPEEVKNSSYLIQPSEILKTAGALQDVSRYVQTLPGVVFGADDFRNDIIVRGGSPLENLFIVDNIEIPNINNFANFASAGGTVSMLDAQLTRDVTFLSGGYPAPYINRLSSVLQIAQREGDREAFRKRATVGFAGAGVVLEGPINNGKGSWITSARRSFIDFFTDDIGFGGVPVNYSFNNKVLYDLTPRDRVWAINLSGIDNVKIRSNPENEDEINGLDIDYDGWRSATGFNWQRLLGERGVGLLGLTHSEAKVGSSVSDQLRGNAQIYRENSREGESTVKYDLTVYAPVLNKVQAGGSFKIFRINYDSAQPLGNDNPFSARPDVNVFALNRSFLATQTGAYIQASQDLGPRLNVTWGGRFDNYRYIGANRFSPRAGLNYRITDKLAARASWGIYHQQPFFLFLSAFPENRRLAPIRADHYVAGFSYVFSDTLRMTLEGYYKTYRQYPVSLEYPGLSLANAGDTFAVPDLLFPMTSAGRGRVRGIELFAEKKFTRKIYGQSNIAFSRARHAALDGVFRPGAFDSPVIFNAVGGYRFNQKWEASLRFVYLTGRPYTPFDQAISVAQRRGVFDLARINGLRAPDYARTDFRVDRTFMIRNKPAIFFVGLQNVANRRNFQGVRWDRRLNQERIGRQLGLFPLIGMDWRF